MSEARKTETRAEEAKSITKSSRRVEAIKRRLKQNKDAVVKSNVNKTDMKNPHHSSYWTNHSNIFMSCILSLSKIQLDLFKTSTTFIITRFES